MHVGRNFVARDVGGGGGGDDDDDADGDGDVEVLFDAGSERVSYLGRLRKELPERGEHNRSVWPLQWNVPQHDHGKTSVAVIQFFSKYLAMSVLFRLDAALHYTRNSLPSNLRQCTLSESSNGCSRTTTLCDI